MNSKRLNSFVSIILFSTILFSCQNAERENEKYQTWQKVEFEKGTIYVSSQRMYSDSQIKLAGAFDEEMKTVSVAFNNHMQASKSQPKDNEWEDSYSIAQPTPDSQPLPMGKHKIAIVATPKDGSKSTTFETEIEIIGKPNVTFTYNRSDFKEQEITAKSDVKLLGITIKTPDGKLLPFKRDPTGLTFTLKYVLPSPKDGKAVAVIQQEENLSFEMKLFMDDPTTQRIYYMNYLRQDYQPVKYFVKSCSLNLDDEQTYFQFPPPSFKDEFLEKVAGFSYEKKLKPNSMLKPMTMSPDKKWILYSYETQLQYGYVSEDSTFKSDYKVDGRQLNNINSYWFCIYNAQTGESKLINKPYSVIYYKTDILQKQVIGYYYANLYWDNDNKLIMKEEYNDEGVYNINPENGKSSLQIKSRIVKYSPENSTFEETKLDEDIVKSDYMQRDPIFNNKYWGITGFNGYLQLRNHFYKLGTKESVLTKDIENQIDKKLIKDYEFASYGISMSIVKNKPNFLVRIDYQYAERFSEGGPYYSRIYKKAMLDFETKKLSPFLKDEFEKIFMPLDNLDMTVVTDDYPTYICEKYEIKSNGEALYMGHQLIKIKDGKVVGVGSPKKIDGGLLGVR